MKRAILLVDHGSRRADANAQLAIVADAVRARDAAHLTGAARVARPQQRRHTQPVSLGEAAHPARDAVRHLARLRARSGRGARVLAWQGG